MIGLAITMWSCATRDVKSPRVYADYYLHYAPKEAILVATGQVGSGAVTIFLLTT
jgi:hypothetical protein